MSSTPIYHITHFRNIAGILQAEGLLSDSERIRKDLKVVGIAHETLKQRRLHKRLLMTMFDSLGDYIPFYFANRSPMLYSIHTGYVEGYDGGQASVVYLVSDAESVAASTSELCFTNGQAVEAITEFFNSLDHLNNIDWDVIKDWSWSNRDDLDRKRRKQAEFLVRNLDQNYWCY